MAKRLSEHQKEEIIKSFQKGECVESISQKLNFSKLTIVRHLKKSLGDLKYKKFMAINKANNLVSKNKKINLKKNLEVDLEKSNTKQNSLVK